MKFLIIAPPKSASTSLMKGLSNNTGLSAKQNSYSIIIDYKDLIEQTSITINSILEFFEIDNKVDGNYNLPQERYHR